MDDSMAIYTKSRKIQKIEKHKCNDRKIVTSNNVTKIIWEHVFKISGDCTLYWTEFIKMLSQFEIM